MHHTCMIKLLLFIFDTKITTDFVNNTIFKKGGFDQKMCSKITVHLHVSVKCGQIRFL